jgi:peptide/nickel transport system ATP-binding protein
MGNLEVRGLSVRLGTGRTTFNALDRVDLTIPEGAVFGLVGESGSGKSTLAKALVGLLPAASGSILLEGRDLTRARGATLRMRRKAIQIVFQDPYSSLNPRMSVAGALGEALLTHHRHLTREHRLAETRRLMDLVGLDLEMTERWPNELSGGQRQRVAIARALAVQPSILVADEITSALDASVQSAVLNLISQLRRRLSLSILLISHNIAIVRYLSDLLGVMYSGQIVEVGSTLEIIENPQHPYTRALLAAVPSLNVLEVGEESALLAADPPDPRMPPTGCRFHPRCPIGPFVDDDRGICRVSDPQISAGTRAHRAACHFAEG